MPNLRRKTKKLVGLKLKEISGVDHPASLFEGWAVMKSSENDIERAVADTITIQTPNSLEKNVDELTTEINEAEEVVSEPEIDVSKQVVNLQKQLNEANEHIDRLHQDAELQKATADVQAWAILPELEMDTFPQVLKSLRIADIDSTQVVEKILNACAIALGEAGILKQVGSDASAEADDSYGQIESLAKTLIADGKADTLPSAIAKVAAQNPELYSAYVAEMGA